MLAVVGKERVNFTQIITEIAVGVMIGVVVPWTAIRLERTRFFSTHADYQPLNAFAIGLLVYTISTIVQANSFLAAFAAGITVATVGPETRDAFYQLGELVSELLKLAALLVFGALISPQFLTAIPVSGYIFVVLVLVAVRPAALMLSLVRSALSWPERVVAAWFGPKGFASVVFGLLILKEAKTKGADWAWADRLFHLIALCIAASIIAHSSTDVVVARWLERHDQSKEEQAPNSFSDA